MLLMMCSSCCELVVVVCSICCWLLLSWLCVIRFSIGRMLLSGVWILWFIVVRNLFLVRVVVLVVCLVVSSFCFSSFCCCICCWIWLCFLFSVLFWCCNWVRWFCVLC